MSSDEDFSLVTDDIKPSKDSLEETKALIANYKKKYAQLVQEQRELATSRDDQREMTQKFKQRSVKLVQELKEDQRLYEENIANEKTKVISMQQEESELMKEILKVQEALKGEEAQNDHLKQQANVFTGVPERLVVFRGSTGSEADTFEMKPHIVYPMEGGTVLVTFEEEVVASKVLDMKKHRVELGSECSITAEARPVQLMLPRLVELDSEVSPQHILISNLPKLETDMLLNKLEIHFSKRKHGGGEVDNCEMLHDSETVVITFVEKDIARGLTDKEHHEVKIQQKMHKVRVTPFLNGKITNLRTEMTVCRRTVLLTGIPDVMERETLQDLLEIHFQKSTNGGGEIEAFLYNPLGQHISAVFEGVSTEREEE
ncbi:interferon-induced protein 35 [Anoplopoma fimbria]|uniref:interferon-induced protein 35 n=1 Tax=Anoplopoma fimbria TaxID=229290 RepID=UPI0023EC4EA7|nr:interferon-induced protein 35 [Anoplopoma fimbria]